jgi:hypothetical protein
MPRLHGHWSRDDSTGDLQTLHVIEAAKGDWDRRRDLKFDRHGDVVLVTILDKGGAPETQNLPLDHAALELLHEKLGEYLKQMMAGSR